MDSLSLFFLIGAYLLGSIPFGKIIAACVAHIDVTQRGSRNIGATNVARQLGVKWGLVTLLLDSLKGFVPTVLYPRIAPGAGSGAELWLAAVGLCALFGHQFSIFLGFRGGKGVATALGVFLGLAPLACLGGAVLFALTVYKWDYVSLGSLVAAAAMPLLMAALGVPMPLVGASAAAALLIFFRHKNNIHRLIKGEERKWRGNSAQPSTSRSLSSSSSE